MSHTPPPIPPSGTSSTTGNSDDASASPERAPETFATGTRDTGREERIVEILKTVFDPEIPVNIYEMGMIYEVRADDAGSAYVKMTLTSPACPVAGSLPGEVERKVKAIDGIEEAKVHLVWDPAWTMEMISEPARLQLNL